ncbi:MAG: GTPase HflX [Chitinispirillales bacterium]|nr:GTPase HflX [Chitinispirillales bacterium]
MDENKTSYEKVVIAGLHLAGSSTTLFEEDMQEMAMLCSTAGAQIAATFVQKKESIAASTYLGEGKLHEIRAFMQENEVKTLIIDAQLSPGQMRNIEKITKSKVLDRSQLILDIFALHAKTVEAKVQVELAQMKNIYPRLTHAWAHFSEGFGSGGIGMRGPGEKQLEVDRRLVQKKIADLKERLKKIEKNRVVQRKSRSAMFKASLVGYTNVGKSSLLNALCGSDVLVEDKLFATLDTATRRVYIQGAGNAVISDTVGFLRKLPHDLVASFRSTLSVAAESDLLIVVLDASSAWIDQQLETVNSVLEELGAGDVEKFYLFNKADLVDDPFVRKQLRLSFPDSLFVSSFSADDMRGVKELLSEVIIRQQQKRKAESIIKEKTKGYQHDRRHVA